jgi:hypothetical protein
MTWLFGQLWFLILLAFLAGSLLTWLTLKVVLPHEDDLEAEAGTSSKGVFS